MKDGGKEFALETEYFDFEAGKWILGEPLPKGERDSTLNCGKIVPIQIWRHLVSNINTAEDSRLSNLIFDSP